MDIRQHDFFLTVYRDLRAVEGTHPSLLREDLRDAWRADGRDSTAFDTAVDALVDDGLARWERCCGEIVCTLTEAGVERTLWLTDPNRRIRSLVEAFVQRWQRWDNPEIHSGVDSLAA